MPNALAEPPCSETVPAESQTLTELTEIVAGLRQEVATLKARFARKRPDTNGRRRTRLDRCPFGWKPNPHDLAVLIQDTAEQQTIFRLVELAQAPVSLRELCRRLDATGCKRRGGKKWADADAHGLVRSILRREGILTPADATAAVLRRIEAVRARAADRYCPETLSDDEARARARGLNPVK